MTDATPSERRIEDEESLEQMLLRSSFGGKHAALDSVVGFLLTRAGKSYADGDEKEARIIRDLAHIFRAWKNEAGAKLDELNKGVLK